MQPNSYDSPFIFPFQEAYQQEDTTGQILLDKYPQEISVTS